MGPAMLGAAFSYGIKGGVLVLPWWLLAFIGALSALPPFWIVECLPGGNTGESQEEEEENRDSGSLAGDIDIDDYDDDNVDVERRLIAKGKSDSFDFDDGPIATVMESSSSRK